MAATSNTTMLSDLFVPQVVADEIDKKLVDAIRFAPLAEIDNTLVGRDGDELTFPFYKYIGDATAVNEGADIPIAKLTADKVKVKVSKIGRGVQVTDEDILIGNANNIVSTATKQILTAINSKVETDFLTAMSTNATLTYTRKTAEADPTVTLANSIMKFGEDLDGEKVLIVPPAFYAELIQSKLWIPNTEVGAQAIIRGSVGSVYGCQVVLSNRLTASNMAYIVKPGALKLVMKRDTLVEFDRDIVDQTNYIVGSKLFAPYLYDTSKLVKIDLTKA